MRTETRNVLVELLGLAGIIFCAAVAWYLLKLITWLVREIGACL